MLLIALGGLALLAGCADGKTEPQYICKEWQGSGRYRECTGGYYVGCYPPLQLDEVVSPDKSRKLTCVLKKDDAK